MKVISLLAATIAVVSAIPPAESKYPKQWGSPPMFGTMDYRAFPGGYGHGSGTEARWIQEHMDQEKKENNGRISFPPAFGEPPAMQTRDFRPLPFGCERPSPPLSVESLTPPRVAHLFAHSYSRRRLRLGHDRHVARAEGPRALRRDRRGVQLGVRRRERGQPPQAHLRCWYPCQRHRSRGGCGREGGYGVRRS